MPWPPPLATRGRSAAPAGTVSAAPALIEFSDGASWKRVPAGLRAGLSALYGVVASSGRDAARDICMQAFLARISWAASRGVQLGARGGRLGRRT